MKRSLFRCSMFVGPSLFAVLAACGTAPGDIFDAAGVAGATASAGRDDLPRAGGAATGGAAASGGVSGARPATDHAQAGTQEQIGEPGGGGQAGSNTLEEASGGVTNSAGSDGREVTAGANSELSGSGGMVEVGQSGAGGAPSAPIELLTGSAALASSAQTGHSAEFANDGLFSTRWTASSGKFPQWWQADLGGTHTLSSFALTFEHADRRYTYRVETSLDGITYTVHASRAEVGPQGGTFKNDVPARYVRIVFTNAAPGDAQHATWASIVECSVSGS